MEDNDIWNIIATHHQILKLKRHANQISSYDTETLEDCSQ